VQAPIRTAFSGPALVRLLARLADLDVQQPGSSLSDRLSQWLGWTDAIALSTALASGAPASSGARAALADEEDACAILRARLAKEITRDERREMEARNARGRNRIAVQAPADEPPADFADHRQRYVSLQQTMETDIGQLRGRLRAALAAHSPEMARLAVVDAVMEQALATRERSLLAQVPMLLGQHFERLKRAHADALPSSWVEPFRKDLQSALLAELEVRFQPVEGLLAALRQR
jgi:hypothetical protein